MTRTFLLLLLASLAASLSADDRPNVVFILADDLGIGDVRCYGGNRCLIDTPNLDALAAEGIRFTDAHVNASYCGPTRRAIMTGRYNWRFAAPVNSGPWGFVGPRPRTDRHTLGKLFRRAGYHTGYVGKWHLGTIMETTDGKRQGPDNTDFSQPLIHGPNQFGFDNSFILPGSLDMFPYAFVRNHIWQGKITAQKGWSAFNRVGPAAEDFEDHEVLETFYRETESFLARQDQERPFFLFLALTAPHTPTSPGAGWKGKSKLGVYGDFVMQVDHAVARVNQALRSGGFEKNTLLLFSSDHGAAPYAGNILKATPAQIKQLERQGHYPSGPHRGYKFSIYEGGLRVPLLARWPGVTPANQTCDSLVGLCDLYATFADLTGQTLENTEAPDSISFASLLKVPSGTSPRTDLVMESTVHFAIRDQQWKLCLTPASGIRADAEVAAGNEPLPKDAWRRALQKFDGPLDDSDLLRPPFVQLFNLSEDPHEDHNLATKEPDRVRNLVALLQQQVDQGRSRPGDRLTNDREIKIVNLNDRRLPKGVAERSRSAGK